MNAPVPAAHIQTKRAYEPPVRADGQRVLVDRLWPRGIKKENLALDDWLKDLAPSDDLRHWFGHEPERWDGFRQRYAAELAATPLALRALDALRQRARQTVLTLVYAAHDEEHNNAIALREFLLHPDLLPTTANTQGETP